MEGDSDCSNMDVRNCAGLGSLRSSSGSSIETNMQSQLSKGFTGQTWYHYDSLYHRQDPITIIHFNDVYNIEMNADGKGGISRFVTAFQSVSGNNPLILFSGDAFNPSWLSAHTKGRHMVPFLNMLRIHTACLGNHDFDFGIDNLEYVVGSTFFPWLISNVKSVETNEPLANGIVYRLFEWQGIRVGIMGLVEREWIDTLADVGPDDIIYKDFVEEANRLSKLLRSKDAELIIALTHMRAPNDERLAYEAEDIDLILGGHDHEYFGVQQLGNCIAAKSGTDFREFTRIIIYPNNTEGFQGKEIEELGHHCNHPSFCPSNNESGVLLMPHFMNGSKLVWDRIDVCSDAFYPNHHVECMVSRYLKEIEVQVDEVIAEVAVPLEARFKMIRTSESNLGNWICDMIRNELHTDVAVLNSGTIRTDAIIPPGVLRIRDVITMLPMQDLLVVLSVTGEEIIKALENSVCMYPKTEGRFLQISGIKFCFDPLNPPGSRVVRSSVYVIHPTLGYSAVEMNKRYSLATKEYLKDGKDGYDIFLHCPIIRDKETTTTLSTMVQNVCMMANLVKCNDKSISKINAKRLNLFKQSNPVTLVNPYGFIKEQETYKMAPSCEGRIRMINSLSA